MLLERFASMGWPKPAGQRLETWRASLAHQSNGAAVAERKHGNRVDPFSSSLNR